MNGGSGQTLSKVPFMVRQAHHERSLPYALVQLICAQFLICLIEGQFSVAISSFSFGGLMCAALIGGMDRLKKHYIAEAERFGINLKVLIGERRIWHRKSGT